MDLQGSIAVITGASRGIGRATAIALARAGAAVVCIGRSTDASPSKLAGTIDETAREVEALGVRALGVRCDVSREAEVEALRERVIAEFGRVDLLVNNAAVNYRAPLADVPVARWEQMMNVNLRGAFLCARAFIPFMRAGSSIINVSSGAATEPAVSAKLGIIPYAVSKAALESLTATLAEELRERQIAVNCLRIESAVATEGARAVDPEGDYSERETPESVAGAIVWMAGRDASWTGKIVTVGEVGRSRRSGSLDPDAGV
jgi:NAD(P)-dependent dehydrogenase (short-subunit alcohol dehydrogenase family)